MHCNCTRSVQKSTTFRAQFYFKLVYYVGLLRRILSNIDIIIYHACAHFFQVKYSLAGNGGGRNYYGRQRRELLPVLGHDDKMATDTMSIQKNCGQDNICVPNLMVQASQ